MVKTNKVMKELHNLKETIKKEWKNLTINEKDKLVKSIALVTISIKKPFPFKERVYNRWENTNYVKIFSMKKNV